MVLALRAYCNLVPELVPIVNEGEEGEGGAAGGAGGVLGPASPNDDALGGPSSSNGKISKAAVLQRSIDYIYYIQVSAVPAF